MSIKRIKVLFALCAMLALPAPAGETERAVSPRPQFPLPETITVPASVFQPVQSGARYDASQGFLVNLSAPMSYTCPVFFPENAVIQKLELIATDPAGTPSISLGFVWRDPSGAGQMVVQFSNTPSWRESANIWSASSPGHYVSPNRIYRLSVDMPQVSDGGNPAAPRFYAARITYIVKTAWL